MHPVAGKDKMGGQRGNMISASRSASPGQHRLVVFRRLLLMLQRSRVLVLPPSRSNRTNPLKAARSALW